MRIRRTAKRRLRIKWKTYGIGGIVSEPDGGELAPTELPLGYVPAAGELIADSDGVVPSFPVRIEPLIVFLRPRRRWARHHHLPLSDLSLPIQPQNWNISPSPSSLLSPIKAQIFLIWVGFFFFFHSWEIAWTWWSRKVTKFEDFLF